MEFNFTYLTTDGQEASYTAVAATLYQAYLQLERLPDFVRVLTHD